MKILVDADACPVKDLIVSTAKQLNLHVIMLFDTSHIYQDDYSEVIIVDKGSDSVDIALANRIEPNDIVVTQDYGVATLALSKRAVAISQNGLIYDDSNIEKLLFERFLSGKARRAGARTSGPKKRTKEDNQKFDRGFNTLCQKQLEMQQQRR